jgi:hypothetical protein
MIPCRQLSCNGFPMTICGKPSTHAYMINGSIPISQSVTSKFINHIECRCDDHVMESFLDFEFIEISIDEAIVRQVLNS